MKQTSAHKELRGRILAELSANEYRKLITPCYIMFQGAPDEQPQPVRIVEVGRYGKNGQCKLVDDFDQLFALSDATEKECQTIIAAMS